MQTTASRVGHKSSAVFGTAERRSYTEEQATKDISVGPAAYNQLQAMKKVIFGKVKGQHALHQKQDVETDVLRRLNFSNSQERLLAKNNMPGPGTYEPPENFEDPQDIIAKGKRLKGVSMTRDESERCILNEGRNVSPGPQMYSSAIA